MLRVRRGIAKDAPAIYRLGAASLLGLSTTDRFYSLREVREILRDKRQVVLVAEANGFVGFLTATILTSESAQLDTVAISPGARGHGIGTLLVSEALDALRAKGIRSVGGLVAFHGKERKFWKKQGFEPGYRFVWMSRRL